MGKLEQFKYKKNNFHSKFKIQFLRFRRYSYELFLLKDLLKI